MDDDAILRSYIPAKWWDEQRARRPLKRQTLYWMLTEPRYEDRKKLIIRALEILETVLAADDRGTAKRAEFVGKFVDDDHQEDMGAELTELVFLSPRSSAIVYAPQFPDKKGPDFQCDLISRQIEVEVTKLSGTESELRAEGLRDQLDDQLSDVPSGRLISFGVLSIRTTEDLAAVYRSMKKWLATQPEEGEHDLANGLRVKVWRTNLDSQQTVVLGHSWKNSGFDPYEKQILRKVRKKAGQLTGLRPGVVVLNADLEYSIMFSETMNSKGQTVFRMHPQISAIVRVSRVRGEAPRTLFQNPWASHPLNEEEVELLTSTRD